MTPRQLRDAANTPWEEPAGCSCGPEGHGSSTACAAYNILATCNDGHVTGAHRRKRCGTQLTPAPKFCGKCSAGYVYRPGDNFIGQRCECNPRRDDYR